MHRWDLTPDEAIALQNELRDRLILHPPAGFAPTRVAGADVSVDQQGRAASGVVIIDRFTMQTVDEASTAVQLTFPYIPGLLSFREIPAVAEAWQRLSLRPDVLIYDGVGYAHPRRFGIASHIGVVLDVPTIGCAKSILVGRHAELGDERGSNVPLVDRGEVVGVVLRTRAGVRPVYVSIGHRMDLDSAVEIVLAMTTTFREPETTRRVHRLVNQVRLGLKERVLDNESLSPR